MTRTILYKPARDPTGWCRQVPAIEQKTAVAHGMLTAARPSMRPFASKNLCARLLAVFITVACVSSTAAASQTAEAGPVHADRQLTGPIGPDVLVRIALERNPGLRAGRARAAATQQMAKAESKLPPPEAEFQIWQIPLSRPYAFDESQMIMLSLMQPIPAPGSLSAREEARQREADVERAMVDERALQIARAVRLAFVDYFEAHAKHQVHLEHQKAAERVLAFAQARYSSGAPITDITQAQVELAKIQADVEQEHARIEAARARINGLLLREPSAALGEPVAGEPRSLAESDQALLARAESRRPEPKTARARTAQRLAESRVAQKEASWPMLSVGASYFAPTDVMPMHGCGLSVSSSLPWLWGRGRAEAEASRAMARATEDDTRDVQAQVRTEVATMAADVRAATKRFQVLRDRALPAAKQAWEAAASGYESGRTDILMLLTARTSVVEVEVDLVEARTALERALVELEWATASPVRTAPIAAAPSRETP